MSAKHPPPSGNITLLFTDIVDSSRMANALGNPTYRASIRESHDARMRTVIAAYNGYEVKTMGDSFMVAFDRVDGAMACACEIQRQFRDAPITHTDKQGRQWTVQVRIGVHKAEYELSPDANRDYHGIDVNYAARVESLARGEQILVSDFARHVAVSREQYTWKGWENRRIKSFEEAPQTVWELLWDGKSKGEPGSAWVPDGFKGEYNQYIPRPALEAQVIKGFAKRLPNGAPLRLVTLHGTGGMGKTRLAVACALKILGIFEGRVHFVELEHAGQPTAVALAEAIGMAMGIEDTQPATVVDALKYGKERLLILDTYESVDSAEVADYLSKLLLEADTVRFLVTSREPVKIADAEQCIDLNQGMTDEEAEALFIARVRLTREERDWPLDTESDRTAIKRIITLLDRIPLALEFAAAWAADMDSLNDVADSLAKTPLGEIAAMPPGERLLRQPDRHRSMTLCLAWSYNLLASEYQEGLARLGLFADTFTAETVQHACGVEHAREVLIRLQKAALIRWAEAGKGSYTMHRFTRAYAAEKCAALPQVDEVQRGYVAYYRRLVEEHGGEENAEIPEKRAVLDREWSNVVAAIDIAETLNDHDALLTLIV